MDNLTRIWLFVPCLVDQLYPEIATHTVAVLEHFGYSVYVPLDQTCCGQPAYNAGYHSDAKRMAKHFLKTFKNAPCIVSPSGSCISMVKNHYPKIDLMSREMEILTRISTHMFEFSQFLFRHIPQTEAFGSFHHRVYFHGSCHGLRELGIMDGPRSIMKKIEGIEMIETDLDQDECCGFGGIFSFYQTALSAAMGQQKIDTILDSDSDYLVFNDAGCLLHLSGLVSRNSKPIIPIHLATLLFRALGLEG